jgi:hypothetical protein
VGSCLTSGVTWPAGQPGIPADGGLGRCTPSRARSQMPVSSASRPMFHFDQHAGDDADFVREVVGAIEGAVRLSTPGVVLLVKIDSWFGPKWLGFSHKVLGALGVAALEDLVVPPFVPNRVVAQRSYHRVDPDYIEVPDEPPLHVHQSSEANAHRKLRDLHPQAALFWWTGNTRQSGRGALMAYLPASGGHTGWYAELQRGTRWSFASLRGVGLPELRALQARAAQHAVSAGAGGAPGR